MDTDSTIITVLSFAGQFLVLAGLVFVLLVGRRRRTGRGPVNTPAPGSAESPLFGEPKEKPKNPRPAREARKH